jgi:hypothetical protein
MPKTLRLILLQAAILVFCSAIQAQSVSRKLVFADDAGRIQIVNADGTGQTKLTGGGVILDDNPAYSPDGSRIAFNRSSGFKTEICLMNADGTNVVTVISAEALTHNRDPSWSPDGSKFVFTSNRSGSGKTEIWMANADGSGLVQLTFSFQKGSDGQGPIFSVDFNPAWSPDGSKIAFVSNREGADTELYVMNADGTNQLRLTNDALDDTLPTWSPDSQRIAFIKSNGAGIHIINGDGTNLVFVISFSAWPAWSPDGSRLAFIQSDSTTPFKGNVYTAKIDGTDKIKITNSPFDGARAPSWAPISAPPIPTFTISGQVKDTNGAPVSGATLTIFQIPIRTTQSDSSGNYSFSGLPTGTYKVDVSKQGYGFIPTSITLTNINSDQTANFTAFVAFTISGQVSGAGSGVPVTLSGSESRSVFTDHDGVYSFNIVRAGGNYTVSINSPFFNVTPPSITFNNLSANEVANFHSVIATYTISGTIKRLGLPKAGFTVRLRNITGDQPVTTTTDANGHYAFTNVVSGRSYSVEPIGANYLAASQGFPSLDGNKIADFELRSANNILFNGASFSVVEGRPSVQISVVRGGNASGVGPITVNYATADGTARAGFDYTAVSGTLEFPEGAFSRTITIPILSDQVYEGSEQFSINLSNATGEVDIVSPSTAVVTIGEVRLITESATDDRAIALNATSLVAEPFSLTTEPNFSQDQRTRISLFVEDLRVFQTFPTIVVEAVDVQQNHIQLPLEGVAFYTFFPFQQLIVRLPENLSTPVLFVTVRVNGSSTNTARIAIKP